MQEYVNKHTQLYLKECNLFQIMGTITVGEEAHGWTEKKPVEQYYRMAFLPNLQEIPPWHIGYGFYISYTEHCLENTILIVRINYPGKPDEVVKIMKVHKRFCQFSCLLHTHTENKRQQSMWIHFAA